VSNATLAQISERYHLIDRLQVPSHAAMLVKSGEKSKANVFESYIAGLFQSFMAESGSTKRTEGQAFDYASEWLTPLFAPIAEYIRSELQAEQQRLSAPNNDQNGEVEIDAAEATGSSAMLNEYCIGTIKTGMPVYETETTEGLMWRTTCRIKLRGGEEV
jgi:ribonuclease-3